MFPLAQNSPTYPDIAFSHDSDLDLIAFCHDSDLDLIAFVSTKQACSFHDKNSKSNIYRRMHIFTFSVNMPNICMVVRMHVHIRGTNVC